MVLKHKTIQSARSIQEQLTSIVAGNINKMDGL